MNTQRLFTISKKLASEIKTLKLTTMVNQLVQQVEAAIGSPNETNQRAVETTLTQLHKSLATAPSNDFSPGIRSELEDLTINGRLSVNSLIGLGLSEELNSAFADGYTSVQSLDKLRQLSKDIQALATALDDINSSFSTLSMRDEELKPGESVVGMSIPRDAIEGRLRGLQREIAFFSRFVGMLTEVIEGTFDEIQVSSIYASEFGIDVFTSLEVAAQFATTIGGIKAAIDMIRGFRKLKGEAQKLGINEKLVQELTKEGEGAVETKLSEIHAEIFQECKVNDDGRVNELKAGIRISLNGLANRLDRGFTFDVRTSLPEGAPDENQKEAAKVKAFSSIRFEPLEGVPVLNLSEGGIENEMPEVESKTTPKTQKRKPKTPS